MDSLPLVIQEIDALRQFVAATRAQGRSIGLVPTMGALHQGHLSLVRLAKRRADCVLVSIYVNPTQFGPKEDLARYPRDLQGDLLALAPLGVEAVFTPSDRTMYPPNFCTFVAVAGMTTCLCGVSRPTHFRGVTTVVAKLFNLVQPDLAVFGEKDYQQLVVIRRMVRDLDFPVEILAGVTVRESDGLAMSSRNVNLTPLQRRSATALHRALSTVRERYREGERDASRLLGLAREMVEGEPELRIDYLELFDPYELHALPLGEGGGLEGPVHMALAVYAGNTRLIDNMRISGED
ncbi:MAG: pantoate--beta-alanine ligase [Bradymonadales bacterium]|nr:pantoate--beta-alanine ligase [Bradymonadales bacterium]